MRRAEVQVSLDSPNEAVRGEKIQLAMKVLGVKRLQLPELDEKFLQRIGGFDSKGDLLDAVRHDLQRQLAYYQQRSVRQQITSLLTESANWELPPEMLRRQAQRELDRAVMELRSSGFTEEQIQAHANLLRQNSQASTATALKEHFILERIAEDEQLETEPSDFDREISLIAEQAGESPRSVRARYEKRGLMDVLRNQIIERKAIQLITSHATITDAAYQPPRDEVSAVDHAVGGEREHIPEAKHGEARVLTEPADHT
jgi:trigger factor